MNQKLKFAFATVITLLTVLWISYCVFCGFIYRCSLVLGRDTMLWAGIVTSACFVVLTGVFLGVQFIKGTDQHFKKNIIWERIFMFALCPICFVGTGYLYTHFFNVHSQSKTITSEFVVSIQETEGIFEAYRMYAEQRIEEYQTALGVSDPSYINDNKVHVLHMRLLPNAVDEMETQCKEWIKDVDDNVTIWNPFLIGNIPFVIDCLKDWQTKLNCFSTFRMTDEGNVMSFDEDNEYMERLLERLSKVQKIYSQWQFPNLLGIFTALLCYILLLFAYLIQERNNKNLYRLFYNPQKTNEYHETTNSQIKRNRGPIVGDF